MVSLSPGVTGRRVLLDKGSVIPVTVSRACINASEPCDAEQCMFSIALSVALQKMFGRRNYYIVSNSVGAMFTLDGYRYQATITQVAGKKIFRYDQVFRKTNDRDAARTAIEPFATEAMISSRAKIAPKITKARKEQINKARRDKLARDRANGVPPPPYRPRGDGSRQLSI